jgi:hypothetical protein
MTNVQDEAAITVNGTRLTPHRGKDRSAALATFADIMANQLGFKDDGIPLTDQYQTDTAHVLAVIEGREQRPQGLPGRLVLCHADRGSSPSASLLWRVEFKMGVSMGVSSPSGYRKPCN